MKVLVVVMNFKAASGAHYSDWIFCFTRGSTAGDRGAACSGRGGFADHYGGNHECEWWKQNFPWLKIEKRWLRRYLSHGKPAIGLCLGGQLIANALGAGVSRNPGQELGWTTVHRVANLPETCFSLPNSLIFCNGTMKHLNCLKGQSIWQKMKPVVIRCTSWVEMYWASSFIRKLPQKHSNCF